MKELNKLIKLLKESGYTLKSFASFQGVLFKVAIIANGNVHIREGMTVYQIMESI